MPDVFEQVRHLVKIWRDSFGDTATVERMEEELGELACGLIQGSGETDARQVAGEKNSWPLH